MHRIPVLCCVLAACVSDPLPDDGAEPAVTVERAVIAPRTALPLHVTSVIAGAPSLTLSTASTIDTTNLQVNGATSAFFVQQAPYAVLFVDALSVTAPVTITGTRPLIIVAQSAMTIGGNVDLHAIGATPGPGATTTGAGGAGTSFKDVRGNNFSSGGGGGGYGTTGAKGGTENATNAPAGAAGAAYGGLDTDPLIGGSPGGAGGSPTGLAGGGGGGALQLSSAVSIQVSAVINAGGGGGTGAVSTGAGGGGAGGEILLEAPQITLGASAVLAANGGGGGGGGGNGGPGFAASPFQGANGTDGQPSTTPAAGGAGGQPAGSTGGAGAGGANAAFTGAQAGSPNDVHGGGGGGGGRIFLRFRGSAAQILPTNQMSPPPAFDSTLP